MENPKQSYWDNTPAPTEEGKESWLTVNSVLYNQASRARNFQTEEKKKKKTKSPLLVDVFTTN